MKKLIILMPIILFVLVACSTIKTEKVYDKDGKLLTEKIYNSSNNFFGKSTNIEATLYGGEVVLANEQNPTPTVRMGVSTMSLNTIPMKQGQSFKITRSTSSIWNSKAVTKTIIAIGQAPGDGVLKVQNDNGDITAKVETDKALK